MDYEAWLEAVENALWSMLGDNLEDYPEANLEELYEIGLDPDEAVYALYESEEDEED